jgi:hypothetical protein
MFCRRRENGAQRARGTGGLSGFAQDATVEDEEARLMQAETLNTGPSKWMLWSGRVISALPVLMLIMSGAMKLTRGADVLKGFADLGYPESVILPLGIVELGSTLLYVIPQTSVLGAILLTGYLGGATATHVRVGQAFIAPVILGVLVWLGLFLRDPRIRALLPLRRQAAG